MYVLLNIELDGSAKYFSLNFVMEPTWKESASVYLERKELKLISACIVGNTLLYPSLEMGWTLEKCSTVGYQFGLILLRCSLGI